MATKKKKPPKKEKPAKKKPRPVAVNYEPPEGFEEPEEGKFDLEVGERAVFEVIEFKPAVHTKFDGPGETSSVIEMIDKRSGQVITWWPNKMAGRKLRACDPQAGGFLWVVREPDGEPPAPGFNAPKLYRIAYRAPEVKDQREGDASYPPGI